MANSKVPGKFLSPEAAVPAKEKLISDFGDSYVLGKYFQMLSFYKAVCNAMVLESDTLLSLLFYRILTDRKAYCYAHTWWKGN